MRVHFRTDASLTIGSGHVMRCITLAQALSRQGAECHFFMRRHPGNRAQAVAAAGFKVELLGESCSLDKEGPSSTPAHAHWLGVNWSEDAMQFRNAAGETPADWLVVDHYSLDERWERAVNGLARRVLVVDDLADRPHSCNLVLDQNLGRVDDDYASLTSVDCVRLIGPRYALLRDGFAALRPVALARRSHSSVQRLLIAMGGVDANDATSCCIQALECLPDSSRLTVDVVMGAEAPHLERVRALCRSVRFNCTVHVDTSEMPALMQHADLALGAAGSSAWERCAMGLPSLLAVIADNQLAGAKALEATGAALLIGDSDQIRDTLPRVWAHANQPEWLESASSSAAAVCDGGGTSRVVRIMQQLS